MIDYLPKIKTLTVPKETALSPDEWINQAVVDFLRAEDLLNHRFVPKLERISDTKFLLHYQSAKK